VDRLAADNTQEDLCQLEACVVGMMVSASREGRLVVGPVANRSSPLSTPLWTRFPGECHSC